MSNTETVLVHSPELGHGGSHPVVSDSEHCPYIPLGTADEGRGDIEQAPTSNALSPPPCEGRGSMLISIWQWASMFFAPVISIAYLTFCFVVHFRVVPANVSGLSTGTMTQFFANLGAGITTINILIISLALFPLRGLLSELQAEEFFRLFSARGNSHGVGLTTINGISNSSYSFIESIVVIVNRHCSLYYAIAFIAAVFVWAVSTLAPPALSIQPILIDGAITAFSVGAIRPLSLYQPVPGGETVLPSSFSPEPGYSAAIAWAEREIGLSYSFSASNDSQGAYSGFVVPTPPMLNSTMTARWLTDVIGINPYCTWANPVNLTATSLNYTMNSTHVPKTAISVHLEEVDLQVSVLSSYFPVYDSFFVSSINVQDPTATVFNYTTGNLPTDGAMVMTVIQCTSTNCTAEAINIISLFVDFTNVPSLRFSSIGADYEMGFLVCKPNITIETREIRTQGSTTLQVQPLAEGASPLPRQGNLDWTQTSLLVSFSLSALSTDSGPASSAWEGLGSETQADFVFGSAQLGSIPSGVNYENTTMVLNPLSTNQLAQGYTQLVKASMKRKRIFVFLMCGQMIFGVVLSAYVSGALGTSFVPGRVASVQQIFVSSLPHVIASTILIMLLLMMAVAIHFRRGKGDQFNLTNIAAALADSELPEMAKRAKIDTVAASTGVHHGWWLRRNVGQDVARKLGNWKISLECPAKAGEVETLHVSRE